MMWKIVGGLLAIAISLTGWLRTYNNYVRADALATARHDSLSYFIGTHEVLILTLKAQVQVAQVMERGFYREKLLSDSLYVDVKHKYDALKRGR